MKGRDWLILGVAAVGAYYLLKKKSEAGSDQLGVAQKAAETVWGYTPLGILGSLFGGASQSGAPLASSAQNVITQAWNTATGNPQANAAAAFAAELNRNLGYQAATAQTGSTGISTIKFAGLNQLAAANAAANYIQQATGVPIGQSGGMSIPGGVAYVPASQAVINTPAKAQAASVAGVVNASASNMASLLATGRI